MNAALDCRPRDALAELLFEDRGAALLRLDPGGRVRRANTAACQAFGEACRPGAIAADLFDLVDRPAVRGLLAKARERSRAEAVCIGGRFAVTVEALRGAADGGADLLLRATDLVGLRNLDPEQTQARKLQALGLLAGGIAHDFNNLLTAVQGAAEAALERGAGTSAADAAATLDDLRTIQDGVSRGQALVQQLLAFGRQQTLQPRVIAANQAVTDLSRLLARVLGRGVRLELGLEEPGRDIRVDPGQLDQVLVNLAVNARNAMPQGGTLSMRTGHSTLVSPLPTSTAAGADSVPPGRYVTISVADTGCGIPPDLLPHLFDPFFTTRRGQDGGGTGGGTGLGLATVHGIVRQSSGYIGVSSTPGVGTCFTIYLPRHVGGPAGPAADVAAPPPRVTTPVSEAPPTPVSESPPTYAAATGCVLLVEDEEAVRRLAARTLRQRGHEVIECATAEAALDLLAEAPCRERLRAVVSDVMLPGLDGVGLLRTVRHRRPGLPALLVSGYADAAQRSALGAEGIRFLAKPYSQKALAESVAVLLAAGDETA